VSRSSCTAVRLREQSTRAVYASSRRARAIALVVRHEAISSRVSAHSQPAASIETFAERKISAAFEDDAGTT